MQELISMFGFVTVLAAGIIGIVLTILTIFLPFFVLRIRNEVIRIKDLLEWMTDEMERRRP